MRRLTPVVVAALLISAAAWPSAAETPPAAEARPAAEELPEILRDRAPSPLHDPQTLQARSLLGLRAEVAALILRGEVGGGIGVAALAVPLPHQTAGPPPAHVSLPAAGEDTSRAEPETPAETEPGADTPADAAAPPVPCQLFVEIDGATFLDTNSTDVARLEVYAYALAADGGVGGHLAEAFAVDIGRLGEAIWQGGLKLYGRLALPPGRYRLRVLVRNAHSGAAGLTESALSVPAPDGARRAVYPLFRTPEGRDAWIPVRSWGGGPDAAEPTYPFVTGDEAVSPAALPVLTAGRTDAALLFDPLPSRGASDRGEPRLELRTADGSQPREVEVESVSPAADDEGLAELRFQVPEIATGDYLLGIAGDESAGVPVVVVADDSGERSLVWTDLRWRLGGERLAEGDPAERMTLETGDDRRRRRGNRRRAGRRHRRAAAEYRAALAPLLVAGNDRGEGGGAPATTAGQRWIAARASLFEYQSSALGEGAGGSLSALQVGALATARGLAESHPESLPVLIRLHEELYGTFRERKLFSLASYNRLMTESLVELYAESGGDAGVAADALVSLGGYLQEANLPSTASRLFRRALALDSGHVEARLALAALYERLGAPRRAAEQLAPAVEAEPDHTEAKLRLAVNLARSGDRRRARQLLAEVAEGSGPSWLRSLAVQELTRQDLATGSPQAAAERIEKFLPELPGDRGLRLLLANAYDRLKRPQEALDLLSAMHPTRSESPRRRYDGWPRDALAATRERLDRAAAERRPELVAGLEAWR